MAGFKRTMTAATGKKLANKMNLRSFKCDNDHSN